MKKIKTPFDLITERKSPMPRPSVMKNKKKGKGSYKRVKKVEY